jgi:hypothetical protein
LGLRRSSRGGLPGSALPAIAAVSLLAATAAGYARFLSTGFAATDSLPLVETSRFSTLGEAATLFAQPVMANTRFVAGEVVYRPFVSVSFGIDHLIWGLNAVGYHLTNLALHLVGVMAIWLLLRQLGLRWWSALIGTSLFALHPLVVATVPVIARRDSLLPVVAFAASAALLLAAERTCGVARIGRLLGCNVLLGVALLSKESAFAALVMLPVVLVGGLLARGVRPVEAISRGRTMLPLYALGAAIFGVRMLVLGGLGGGSDANLSQLDWDRYSQILGAFTRDLLWPFAWIAPSTRELWPRLADVLVLGVALTAWHLPRRFAVLVVVGGLWIAGFAAFAMVLKIATVAWLGYFALIGVAILVAAGVEGALMAVRLERPLERLKQRAGQVLAAVLLVGLSIFTASALWASVLFRPYPQWQVAGDATERYSQALHTCVAEAPLATRVRIVSLASSYDDGQFETSLLGVTLLEDWTLDSMLRLAFPGRKLEVGVTSWDTLRGGADTLRFNCSQSGDSVELTTSY